eukprot:PhF_6_TR4528/c0_g1_i1/m.6349
MAHTDDPGVLHRRGHRILSTTFRTSNRCPQVLGEGERCCPQCATILERPDESKWFEPRCHRVCTISPRPPPCPESAVRHEQHHQDRSQTRGPNLGQVHG